MSYSLIVVDMQSSFAAATKPKIQQRCLREISKAIRDKAPIILVEYAGHGTTLPLLTQPMTQAHHRKVFRVLKAQNDGSNEVIECLRGKHLPRLNLRVVGVNTAWCVKDTVIGLSHKLPNSTIRVIGDACNCWSDSSHIEGLKDMNFLPNTKLLRTPWIS